MSIVFGDPFEHLVTEVSAYFQRHGVTAEVRAGFRERARRDQQGPGSANRVVFLPADPSGRGGRIHVLREGGEREVYDRSVDPPRVVARVRSIGDWERQMVVSIWAADVSTEEKARSELAQIVAVTRLLEWTKRAIDYAGGARIVYGDTAFTVPRQNSFGQEVLLGVTLQHPLFDVPREVTTFAVPKISKS